jgi:hypothetical protein
VVIVISIVFAVLVVGAVLYARWHQTKERASWPTTWIISGTPPRGIWTALDIIEQSAPGLPSAGYIDWVEGPFEMVPGFKVAGTVISTEPIRIKVMWAEKIEDTALAHECGHAWSDLTHQGFGESPQDKKFVAWFTDVNHKIAVAMGRG